MSHTSDTSLPASSAAMPAALSESSGPGRWQFLLTGTLAAAVLGLAGWLPPSPRGVGTHQLLGLPPCMFLHLTGWPCPGCGMTTCFAWAAKLHFHEALVTHPFGLLVFFLTALAVPLSALLAWRPVPWQRIAASGYARRLMKLMLILWLLSWGYKVMVMH